MGGRVNRVFANSWSVNYDHHRFLVCSFRWFISQTSFLLGYWPIGSARIWAFSQIFQPLFAIYLTFFRQETTSVSDYGFLWSSPRARLPRSPRKSVKRLKICQAAAAADPLKIVTMTWVWKIWKADPQGFAAYSLHPLIRLATVKFTTRYIGYGPDWRKLKMWRLWSNPSSGDRAVSVDILFTAAATACETA